MRRTIGYNGIKLKLPEPSSKVSRGFEGIVGAEGFHSIQPEKAGWRYGFLAVEEDGTRNYGEVFSNRRAAPNSPAR